MRRSQDEIKKREDSILNYIHVHGSISVQQMCELYSISPSTARNHLNSLYKRNLVERLHGGASKIQNPSPKKFDFSKYVIENENAKDQIAVKTCSLIHEGDILALAGGTTTYLLSKHLHDIGRLTVVTNSLLVAYELMGNPDIDVRLSGGIVNHKKGSLYGIVAENFFKNIRINKFIFSADAININEGATVIDSNISYLERVMLSNSKQSILIADSLKFNRNVTIDSVADFSEIDYLVTDSDTPASILESISQMGVKILTP